MPPSDTSAKFPISNPGVDRCDIIDLRGIAPGKMSKEQLDQYATASEIYAYLVRVDKYSPRETDDLQYAMGLRRQLGNAALKLFYFDNFDNGKQESIAFAVDAEDRLRITTGIEGMDKDAIIKNGTLLTTDKEYKRIRPLMPDILAIGSSMLKGRKLEDLSAAEYQTLAESLRVNGADMGADWQDTKATSTPLPTFQVYPPDDHRTSPILSYKLSADNFHMREHGSPENPVFFYGLGKDGRLWLNVVDSVNRDVEGTAVHFDEHGKPLPRDPLQDLAAVIETTRQNVCATAEVAPLTSSGIHALEISCPATPPGPAGKNSDILKR